MHRVPLAITLALMIGLLAVRAPSVEAEAHTVDDVKAAFGSWTAEMAVANGYEAEPFCVDGSLFGMPELGTNGLSLHQA